MSNERKDSDRLVSNAYHELASEKTPETLNREVLRLAAKEGRTRYSIARGWMRPAAWAATIGLSLVIVLELSDMPGTEMAPVPQSAPAETAVIPDVSDERPDSGTDDMTQESKLKEEQQEALEKRSRPYSPEEQVPEKAVMLNDAASAVSDVPDTEIASQDNSLLENAEPADQDSMEATIERARKQVEQPGVVEMKVRQSAEQAPAAERFAVGVASMRAEPDYLCPAERRLTAEKWLQCIVELEETSPRELVEREYEEFGKSYPDFEHPAPDK